MTHQAPHDYAPGLADAGGQVAQLRQVLALIGEIAGRGERRPDAALDEAARISAAYDTAPPVAQRRFDRIASETERWAALGVETLLRLQEQRRPTGPAAAALAEALGRALGDLRRTIPA